MHNRYTLVPRRYNTFSVALHDPNVAKVWTRVNQSCALTPVLVWTCLALFCGLQPHVFATPPVFTLVTDNRLVTGLKFGCPVTTSVTSPLYQPLGICYSFDSARSLESDHPITSRVRLESFLLPYGMYSPVTATVPSLAFDHTPACRVTQIVPRRLLGFLPERI
jgi:hypothetical protein